MTAPSHTLRLRVLFGLGMGCLLLGLGMTSCGGGDSTDEGPINVDYSGLKVADSRETPLAYAQNDEQILRPLRNGVRMTLAGGGSGAFDSVLPAVTQSGGSHSTTTVQIEGVDEADSVKYDGRYIYSVRQEIVPSSPTSLVLSRNVLDIKRTDALTAGVEPVSKFIIEGEQSTTPLLYGLQNSGGATDHLLAVSQNFHGWLMPQVPVIGLVLQPDKTTLQLLNVADPTNVSQAWKVEIDGWLKASRMIDGTLYLVSSYRPRMPDLILPADTLEKREANERRIRSSAAGALFPSYTENGGPRRQLVRPDRCLITQQMGEQESYSDLLVIVAIDVRARRLTDVNCLSTNANAVYVSRERLYVAGSGLSQNGPITVLHKFALDEGEISYRATGAVVGQIGWTNASYFMDEYEDDLRILTTAGGTHHLTVLRESTGRSLMLVSAIPNSNRPEPIGKPGEAVQAVRFMGERAYVVTFRVTDPLYVIDLKNPADPRISGELEIPGFSTYLRPVGATQSEWLLAVGQEVDTGGRPDGVKVELFDVRDIAHPQSVGSEVFGRTFTFSEALSDPHALAFLTMPGTPARYRLALPIQVFDTPRPTDPNQFSWTYSGLHVFEISGDPSGVPQLHFQGVIRTQSASEETPSPSYTPPNRGILHGDSVFAVHGTQVLSSRWQDLPNR